MDRVDRLVLLMGYLLLVFGIGNYIRLALFGKGSVLVSFICLMSCLFFFNWPTVRAKRKIREKHLTDTDREGSSLNPPEN